MADLRDWEERAAMGEGQYAIALAVWQCADMLNRLGLSGIAGGPGAIEYIGMVLDKQVGAIESAASAIESVASAIESAGLPQ